MRRRANQLYSPAAMRRREKAVKAGMFAPVSEHSIKTMCVVCTGQGSSNHGFIGGSWMDKHIAGHTTCTCGRVVPTKSLLLHIAHHPKKGTTT